MIDNNGIINVINEDGINIKVDVLFDFAIEELGKKYIVYTIENQSQDDMQDVLISELDCDNYCIKSISENDMNYVLEMYEKAKETILNS